MESFYSIIELDSNEVEMKLGNISPPARNFF